MHYIYKSKRHKLKFYNQLTVLSLAVVIFFWSLLTIAPLRSQENAIANVPSIQLPLSTRGAKILDAQGKPVILRGVNWFGIETETNVPHGLWKRDYKDILTQIKSLGYNLIRLPYSLQALRSTNISGIDFSIGNNKALEGKNPLEVMDLIIQEAEHQGLLILLDCHRLNNQRISELWYEDSFTEKDWIDTWKMLADRYKNQTNIIGADLKNEPHGKASWGTNDVATDWRLAAERAGNAILEVNPNWLIVVGGVEKNVPNQKLPKHWQGGNLEGVQRYPVRLSNRSKLVYSPHEYGPGVADQPWFSERSFPKNLINRWQIGFHYISSQNRAPILIGEFGGRQVDTSSKEGIWQNEFVKYIKEKNLSFAYWSWNPNSADTGGLLLDDWQNIDLPKQQLLTQLLPVTFTQLASRQLTVTSDIYTNWQTGFCVSFKIHNQSSTKVNNWQLTFQMKQAAINNSWNGNFQPQGTARYLATPLDWGRVIEPNQVREVGFCANKLGLDYQPTNVKVE
ncbi:glycoside hydrolase [Scytonema hofmannii PCC 7110]|uniref:Endoglucanase n=1 Tax=Scytonema hofmannii PCC 7110 TaxID=128403 RepID=A0A139X1E3_9CYAN|nr:cellulase family glycosylhydrolase [Scytonema hofmannii]KYC38515.1 glycoside hydrolase [Scytonema hofmannii PCC 7110]